MWEIIGQIQLHFDHTITLGNLIASMSFVISTSLGIWRFSALIRDKNDARLDELEKRNAVIITKLEAIEKRLDGKRSC